MAETSQETPAAAAPPATDKPAPKKKSSKKSGGFSLFGKKKKSGPPDVLWTVKLERRLHALSDGAREIFGGLVSRDAWMRRMSFLFVLSCVGLGTVIWMAAERYREQALLAGKGVEEDDTATNLGNLFGRTAEEAKRKYTIQNIGEFTVELRKAEGDLKVPGVINLAEVELVVECDSKQTCVYVEEHLAQARNQVTNVFVALDREALLSREGKRKIKKMMVEKLNLWLPHGKIENLFFSKLIIS